MLERHAFTTETQLGVPFAIRIQGATSFVHCPARIQGRLTDIFRFATGSDIAILWGYMHVTLGRLAHALPLSVRCSGRHHAA
jgi:hypothetical protein